MTTQWTDVLRELDERPTLASYSQAAREMRSFSNHLQPMKVGHLATFTIDMLVPCFEIEAARLGFATDVYNGPFNAVRQELLDPRSGCSAHGCQSVFIAQLLEDVCPPLAHDFLALEESRVDELIEETVAELTAALRTFRQHSQAAVAVYNFVLPSEPSLGILEAMLPNSQTVAIRRLNEKLAASITELPGMYVLDFDRVCAGIGYRNWRHDKLWYAGHAPLAPELLPPLARAQAAFVQAVAGVPRKCLVLDLDNTLWGGIVGEDGVAGIQLGHDYPGNVFVDVQRAVIQLHRRGVVLAINSKNNETDVDAVFRTHPHMLLKREHFAATRVNWRSKADNLVEIAQELNIGVDSIVFLDDSPAECALMRQVMPPVLTWEAFDSDGQPDPIKSRKLLLESGVFDKLSLTADDRQRGQMYQEQAARRALQESAATLDAFLIGLEITADIQPVDEFTLPRVVDLVNKTNQFNVTTRRYGAAEVDAMAADPSCAIFTLRTTDRFGDNGVVGVAIARRKGEIVEIDTFLLSCRVIGRKVETALLAHLVEWTKKQGAEYLQGFYLPTAKNAPAASFFADHGFLRVEGNGSSSQWLLPLDQVPFEWPSFIDTAGEMLARTAPAVNDVSLQVDAPGRDRLVKMLAAVLAVEPGELSDESSPATIASWDSLNHLNVVLALESEYGISLSPHEVVEMQSVGRIRQVLGKARTGEPGEEIVFQDCSAAQVPAFREFLARSYGADYVLGVNDDYFRWQFGGRSGELVNVYRVTLAMVEGRVAGCLGYIPLDVNVAGRTYRGAWLANWMVDPAHRQLGLGPLLAREITREFEITLALGANADAHSILARMGWTDFGRLTRYVAVLDVEGAGSLTESGNLTWPQISRSSTHAPLRARIERVARFGAEAGRLWDDLYGISSGYAGTRRSERFLKWRYTEHPTFRYELFEARRGNQLAGFAVYRVEQARELEVRIGRLVELVAQTDVEDELLAAILEDARKHEAVAMDFFCATGRFGSLLSRHGFLAGDDPRAAQIPMLYQPLDRRRAEIRFLADLRNMPTDAASLEWYVMKSDGDQDRPN